VTVSLQEIDCSRQPVLRASDPFRARAVAGISDSSTLTVWPSSMQPTDESIRAIDSPEAGNTNGRHEGHPP